MKKIFLLIVPLAVILITGIIFLSGTSSATAKGGKYAGCTTIQSGLLTAEDGTPLTTGYDQYGYNYQAHMFNGRYCDADRIEGGAYCDVNLVMKWDDAWISNMDCDGDKLLDRHYGFDSYIGSGAWLTNEQRGVEEGKTWTYFTKIVAKPTAEYTCPEPGYEIWGAFCVIQEVNGGYPPLNEPYGGNGAVLLVKPAGFGAWK